MSALETLRVKNNALVPNNAPIQPPQAFVDAMGAFFTDPDNPPTKIELVSKGLASISLTNVVLDQIFGGINLSGNALDQASVDNIIHSVASNENAVGNAPTIDISGGSNAVPLLPVFVIDFSGLIMEPGYYGECKLVGDGCLIVFEPEPVSLSDSEIFWTIAEDTDFFLKIGIGDSPTKQQIINKLVAIGGGKITDLGGLKISVAPSDYDLLPIIFNDVPIGQQNNGFTYLGNMPGSAFTQGNNDVGTIRRGTGTVITN